MRRLLTWIVVTLGIAAVARRLRKRGQAADESPAPVAKEDDPAGELRQKLAESRSDEAAAEEAAVTPEASVEERRADVHEQGRSTLDEMREPNDT